MTVTNPETEKSIQTAVRQIVDALDNPPTPAQVADKAGFSRFHFSRVFTALGGESMTELAKRLRLERAAEHPRSTDRGVLDIAMDAGFTSNEAFTRAFRALYKVNPSDFRKQDRYRVELPTANGLHYGHDIQKLILMNMETKSKTEIETLPAMRFLCLEHRGPYYTIGQTFGKLMQIVGPTGIPIELTVGFYYDDPGSTNPEELRSDAGVQVPADFENTNPDLHIVDLPAGEYLKCTHMGPYDQLSDAWDRFMASVPASGRKADNQWNFELYRNDCSKVAPEDLHTDMYTSVAPE